MTRAALGVAALLAAAPATARSVEEQAYIRASSEGFAAGRALSCQAMTRPDADRLANLVADAAIRARQTSNRPRMLQNFAGGLDGGLRTAQGPSDDSCDTVRKDIAAIAARYGLPLR